MLFLVMFNYGVYFAVMFSVSVLVILWMISQRELRRWEMFSVKNLYR